MWHKRAYAPLLAWFAAITIGIATIYGQTSTGPQASATLQQAPPAGLAVSLPGGPMAEKAATACTECHESRIIVQQRLSKAGWTKEVDKMVKWGAVVDADDRDALIDYFSTNFGPDKPAYDPPRTSSQKGSGQKSAGKDSGALKK